MSVSDGSYVTELAERWSSACAEVDLVSLGGFPIFLGGFINENPGKSQENQWPKSTSKINGRDF